MADEVIEFRCSECQTQFSVPAAKAGGWLFCKKCRVNIAVPKVSEARATEAPFDILKDLVSGLPPTPSPRPAGKPLPVPSPPPPPSQSNSRASVRPPATEEDLAAAIRRKRPRVSEDVNTYTLASESQKEEFDDLEVVAPAATDLDDDAFELQPAVRSAGGKQRPGPQRAMRYEDQESDSAGRSLKKLDSVDSWQLFGWIVLGEAGLLFMGICMAFLVPSLALLLLVGYVLTGLALFGTSWGAGIVHALREEDYLSAVLFFFPMYFIRYGIRNWPETRLSMAALALAMIWLVAPFVVGVPLGFLMRAMMPEKQPGAKNPWLIRSESPLRNGSFALVTSARQTEAARLL